jgi:hypothetical protein
MGWPGRGIGIWFRSEYDRMIGHSGINGVGYHDISTEHHRAIYQDNDNTFTHLHTTYP